MFGFVNGDFVSGKIHDIHVTENCFVLEYCLSENLLAVGLLQGGGVALYETSSYSLVTTLERHDSVSSLEWLSIDNSNTNMLLLAVGGLDGVVTLYQLEMGSLESQGSTILHEFGVASQVRSMTLNICGDGSTLLWTVGDKSGVVTLCTLGTEEGDSMRIVPKSKNVEYTTFDSGILGLAMNKSATFLAITTKGGKVIVRSIQQQHSSKSGSKTTIILTNEVFSAQRLGPVRSAVFSQDEKRLVFGGYDKTVIIVDTRLWAITRELKVEGTINVLSFDSQQRYLAVGNRDKSFVLYDTSSWCPLKTIHTPGWVTSISWAPSSMENIVAVRTEPGCVSILDLTPIHSTDVHMSSNNDPETSTSWTRFGHYVARTKGNTVVIADARNEFTDVASFDTGGYVRCLAFSTAEDKSDLLAVVNTAGYLYVLRLVMTDSAVSLEVEHSSFIEEHLWVVAWSSGEFGGRSAVVSLCSRCSTSSYSRASPSRLIVDGKLLATGGRGKALHIFSTSTFKLHRDPMQLGGRLWGIDFIPKTVIDGVGIKTLLASMALGTGDYLATLYDGTAYLETLRVMRTRTVRCVKYHPRLPRLAIGDGSNLVAIVDYIDEELVEEFNVGGRVNCLEFSADGNFLVVGTDGCRFTIRETLSFKAVQEIPSSGFATSASFSPTGEFLVLGSAGGDYEYSVVRMGPLLATDLVPLSPTSELSSLPPWALNEALFRSGDGPSLVQRYMLDGSPESVFLVAALLKRSPDALYTFDRTTGEGCFDTALALQRPNLLKLTLTILVDGTLEAETNNGGKRSILTTDLPDRGSEALYNMIFNQPQLINDILAAMTFIKVPFTQPHEYHRKDMHVSSLKHIT